MNDQHHHQRAAGRRTQATHRAVANVGTREATMPRRGLYQHSPTASKGNAFCWLTWAPQIDAAALPPATMAEAGDDGTVTPSNARGAARKQPTTTAGRLRVMLARGPQDPEDLAKAVGIPWPSAVRAYLKRDLESGTVVIVKGKYQLAGGVTA